MYRVFLCRKPTFLQRKSIMSSLALKLILLTLFLLSCYHLLRSGYLTHYHSIGTRSLTVETLNSWQCELNKRLIQELQREIREKDQLLRYRGKVIGNLRKEVSRLNTTVKSLNEGMCNITEFGSTLTHNDSTLKLNHSKRVILDGDLFKKNKIHFQPSSPLPSPTPFPADLQEKAGKCTRPCCIALKRMTDIMREYMETTKTLRERVNAYENLNLTNLLENYAEAERQKLAVLNCTQRFKNFHIGKHSDKQERHAQFQTFQNNYMYEIPSPARQYHSVKIHNKSGNHRDRDFLEASNFGLSEVKKLFLKKPGDHVSLSSGFVRVDELKGMIYKLNYATNTSRSFMVDLLKPFGPYILSTKVNEVTNKEKELINIIIPMSEYTDRFTLFLKNIEEIIRNKEENIFLTLIIHGTDEKNRIKNAFRNFSKKNNFSKFDIMKKNTPFNRGRALHDGIKRWNGDEKVLFFFCDIDIRFNARFLKRCRQNTNLGQSVYMPILFSLYNPDVVYGQGVKRNATLATRIDNESGMWRSLGYGMVCVYKPDYFSVKGFNLNLEGWGSEDVILYRR